MYETMKMKYGYTVRLKNTEQLNIQVAMGMSRTVG